MKVRVAKFSFISAVFPTHPASGKVDDSREVGPSTTSSTSELKHAATLEYLPDAKSKEVNKSKAAGKDTYEHENAPAAVATTCGLTPAEQSAAVGKGNKERGRPRKKGTPKARASKPKAKSAPKAKAKAKAKSQSKKATHDTGKKPSSKKKTAAKAAPVEDTGDTTASGSDAKGDTTYTEVVEAKAPRKRMAKKSRKVREIEKATEAEAVEAVEAVKAPGKKKKKAKLAATPAPAEASASPVTKSKAKSKPTKKGNATKSTRAKAGSESAGSKEPTSKANGSTEDDKKLQQKQKNARKSLAYRQACKKAKDEGLDDDACKAAGRKVLWQHLLIYILVHNFRSRTCQHDFVVTFGSSEAGLSLGIKAYKDAE